MLKINKTNTRAYPAKNRENRFSKNLSSYLYLHKKIENYIRNEKKNNIKILVEDKP